MVRSSLPYSDCHVGPACCCGEQINPAHLPVSSVPSQAYSVSEGKGGLSSSGVLSWWGTLLVCSAGGWKCELGLVAFQSVAWPRLHPLSLNRPIPSCGLPESLPPGRPRKTEPFY